MDKKTRNILIISGSILLIGAGILLFVPRNKQSDSTKGDNGDDKTNDSPLDPTKLNASFPLKKGSKGKQVVALQKYLNDASSDNALSLDGIFGQKTENAVIKRTMFVRNIYPDMKQGEINLKYYNDNVISYE